MGVTPFETKAGGSKAEDPGHREEQSPPRFV